MSAVDLDSTRTPPAPKDRRDPRSEFERDKDRLLHTYAFHALGGKTQIYPVNWVGHGRNRLSHSLETGQIGSYVALVVGEAAGLQPDDRRALAEITKTACFAHDLGHPPFGHSGERKLHALMREHGERFESNAQSLRIVSTLEAHDQAGEGLNLTAAVRRAVVKYPYSVEKDSDKKGVYDDDEAKIRDLWGLAAGADLPESRSDHPARTLAGQLMDWADDVAYAIHDFEDGVLGGVLGSELIAYRPDELANRLVDRLDEEGVYPERTRRIESLRARSHVVDEKWSGICNLGRAAALSGSVSPFGYGQRAWGKKEVARLRGHTRALIQWLTNECVGVDRRDDTETSVSGDEFRLTISEDGRNLVALLKSLEFNAMYHEPMLVRYLHRGQEMIGQVFATLLDDPSVVTDVRRNQLGVLQRGDGAERATPREVADAIASMTEQQLHALHGQLSVG